MLRALATLVLAALLSGCWWVGAPFYQPDPKVALPLPPGRYIAADTDNRKTTTKTIVIGRAPDGAVTVTEDVPDAQTDRGVFVPLQHGVWITQAMLPGDKMAVYGVAVPQPDGSWQLAPVIPCKANQELALAAGATLRTEEKSKGEPFCVFPNRAALEKGLRASYAAQRPFTPTVTWRRVP